MKRLEDELRNALRRKEAPPGFAERVAGRISTQAFQKENQWRRWSFLFRRSKLGWVAAGVIACLALFLGIAQFRSYQKTRAEGELAKSQLMLALKIAGKKLSFAQRKVLEIHNRGVPAQRGRDQ